MKFLDDIDDFETEELNFDINTSLANTRFHEDSVGSQNEFFDDHQKWLIDSFDSL